jgi:hypothetical protein
MLISGGEEVQPSYYFIFQLAILVKLLSPFELEVFVKRDMLASLEFLRHLECWGNSARSFSFQVILIMLFLFYPSLLFCLITLFLI